MTPVEVSLWAQASTSAAGSATGSGASPGSASITIGSARKGAAGGRLGELLRELAVGQVEGAIAHEPGLAASQKAVVPPLPRAIS